MSQETGMVAEGLWEKVYMISSIPWLPLLSIFTIIKSLLLGSKSNGDNIEKKNFLFSHKCFPSFHATSQVIFSYNFNTGDLTSQWNHIQNVIWPLTRWAVLGCTYMLMCTYVQQLKNTKFCQGKPSELLKNSKFCPLSSCQAITGATYMVSVLGQQQYPKTFHAGASV